MGQITVATILLQARENLRDQDAPYRFSDDTLLEYLNSGQRRIVLLKPNASVTNRAFQLAGGTKQQLPADGVALIDVTRNMGSNGNLPGRTVIKKDRKVMDVIIPLWHQATPAAEVKIVMFDDRDPRTFYVYPPQPTFGMGYVEGVYSSITDAQNPGTISLDDIYEMALVDYISFRGLRKEDPALAQTFYQSFMQAVSDKWQGEKIIEPTPQATGAQQ